MNGILLSLWGRDLFKLLAVGIGLKCLMELVETFANTKMRNTFKKCCLTKYSLISGCKSAFRNHTRREKAL